MLGWLGGKASSRQERCSWGLPSPLAPLFRAPETTAALNNSSQHPSQEGFQYNKPGVFSPLPFPAAVFKVIPCLSPHSFAEAHPCSLCLWKLFVSLEEKKTKMIFPSCCKRADWLGDLLSFYCLIPALPCPAACGPAQCCSNTSAGAFVEINASSIRGGLLA